VIGGEKLESPRYRGGESTRGGGEKKDGNETPLYPGEGRGGASGRPESR